ncbi:tRNA (adenine(22)-N(1))-methyltransferase [Shimazuella kribbensis]|uniref:tRNA (adenine(22)-N(1))-methyltransferase n=1 Tax=Shimazuella kribbensis TaxID=139808 RepID=UPI000405464B|nr:class I SAM-dependent methyltransferase [Shimazuella kribbensis]
MKELLSRRLKEVAKFVPNGTKVADIGADHGKLLVYLAEQKIIFSGIAGEVNQGPWKNAADFVYKKGLQKTIDVRLGDGLDVIQEQVDVIVIAGMGGTLITSILEQGKAKLSGVQRLILQPNIGENKIRSWLDQNDWQLVDENIVMEDHIYYEILVAEQRIMDTSVYDQLPLHKERFYQIGPLLWKKKHVLLIPKLNLDLERKREVRNQLKLAKVDGIGEKLTQIEAEIQDKEQVIMWLSMEEHS